MAGISKPRAADLNELSVFVRVAQLSSFSAAARALQLPVSTVSRKVAELEARLGVRLIKRTTRKLNLSEHGLQFYESCAPHLVALEQAEAGLTRVRPELEGHLHVTAPVSLGRGEFIAFVSRFAFAHPALQIDLTITNDYMDLVASDVDVALRFGDLSDSSIVARHLGVSRRLLVASPEYLKRKGTPRTPADLRAHDCVLFPGRSGPAEWQLHASKRRVRVPITARASANNLETVNELTLRGHGISLLPEPYAVDGVATGTLKRILSPWTSAPVPVHAVYLGRKFVAANVQAFVAALAGWENSTWRKVRKD